ncbi:hypothetical protein HAALTHF_29290n [Vreelandella aquamarina]|nr:hypothetical protein HAALTHF_29290n [Halomonas axialensis]
MCPCPLELHSGGDAACFGFFKHSVPFTVGHADDLAFQLLLETLNELGVAGEADF